MLSASIPKPIPIARLRPRPKTRTAIRFRPISILGPSQISELFSVDVDELERIEIPKPENTSYQWYDWLISYIPEFMKKSDNTINQKVYEPFEPNNRSIHPWTINQKNVDVFERRYVEYKSEKDKKPSMKRYSEKIRVQLRDMIDDLMEDASDNET